MKHTLFAVLLLALTASAVAQQKEAPVCTVRILLINQDWDDRTQTRELMSPHQMKWWLEDGQKKFKNFCFVSASQPHDYRIVWTDTATHQTRTFPTAITTNGTVTSGNRTADYSETTYGSRTKTVTTLFVQVRLFKAADTETNTVPLFNELHKGDWIWSKPDRAALEKALKALAKLTKTSRKL